MVDDAKVPDVPGKPNQADARYVLQLAFSLGDGASVERIASIVSMLLDQMNADLGRLEVAAGVCQSAQVPGSDDGYPEATALIQRAIERIRTAGADRDPDKLDQLRRDLHAEWHPDPLPFEWDRYRRHSVGWWARYLRFRTARLAYQPATAPAGTQTITIQVAGREVGKLRYVVCSECRLALVGKVDVDGAYQGLNLGTRLVAAAYARHPNYEWRTTTHYPTSGTFWTRMAHRTGASFVEGQRCSHMDHDRFRG